MKIQITADSTCDLSQELYQKYDIKVIPFVVTLGDETYLDGSEIKPEDIFSYFDKNKELPKTGARSPEDLKKFFEPILKDGYEIIHFGIGSKLSSGYANCELVAKENSKIHLVNTKTLSSGSGLLAIYASELARTGKYTASQIAEMASKRADFHQTSFIVERLNYLYKGGRCSMISLLGANLLGIKPCLQLKDGEIKVGKKYIGSTPNCLKKYIQDELSIYNTPDHTRVMITYSTATDKMIEMAKSTLESYGKFKEILITQAGGVISSHCGENTLGILYLNDGDEGHY